MSWEYIAGFFDGEGNAQSRCMANGRYVSKLRFTQCSHSDNVLYAIAEFLSGFDIVARFEWQDTGGDIQTILNISRKRDMLTVLDAIANLVIVKRQQVDAARTDLTRYFALREQHGNKYVQYMYVGRG